MRKMRGDITVMYIRVDIRFMRKDIDHATLKKCNMKDKGLNVK